jgi:hypothetical protein
MFFKKPVKPIAWYKRALPVTPLGLAAMGACYVVGSLCAETIIRTLTSRTVRAVGMYRPSEEEERYVQ